MDRDFEQELWQVVRCLKKKNLKRDVRLMHEERLKALLWPLFLGRILRYFPRDFHLAEDLAQECLIKAFNKVKGIKKPGQGQSLASYFNQIAIWAALDRLKLKGPQAEVLLSAEELQRQLNADPLRQRENPAEAEEERALLRTVLGILGPKCEELLTMALDSGLTPAQIAEIKRTSPGAVREQIRRCLKKGEALYKTLSNEKRPWI